MTTWRDAVKAHLAAELFPLMSGDELRDLGDDIQKNNLQSPVTLLRPKDGGDPLLLDGRNRLDAMEAVGLPMIGDNGKLLAPHETIDEVPSFNAADFVVSANIRRRHLTGEQRADVIRKLKAERPSLSIRAVAEITGASAATVHRAINKNSELSGVPLETPDPEPTPTAEGVPVGTPAQTEAVEAVPNDSAEPRPDVGLPETSALEEAISVIGIFEQEASSSSTKPEQASAVAEIPQPRITGRDGKAYPAKGKPKSLADRRLSAAAKTAARKAPLLKQAAHRLSPAQERDQAVGVVARLLRSERLVDALDDLVRLLCDERGRIAGIPLQKRVIIARGYLIALDVALDELRPIEEAS